MVWPPRLVLTKTAFGSGLYIPQRGAWGGSLIFWLKTCFYGTPYWPEITPHWSWSTYTDTRCYQGSHKIPPNDANTERDEKMAMRIWIKRVPSRPIRGHIKYHPNDTKIERDEDLNQMYASAPIRGQINLWAISAPPATVTFELVLIESLPFGSIVFEKKRKPVKSEKMWTFSATLFNSSILHPGHSLQWNLYLGG